MRIKVQGFLTKPSFRVLIESLFNEYNDEIDIMTGVNIYFTPRKNDGTEIIINKPDGTQIETLNYDASPRKKIEVQPKKQTPKKPAAPVTMILFIFFGRARNN